MPAGSVISGSPAFEARDWLRAVTTFPKIPALLKTLRQLESRVAELERERGARPGDARTGHNPVAS